MRYLHSSRLRRTGLLVTGLLLIAGQSSALPTRDELLPLTNSHASDLVAQGSPGVPLAPTVPATNPVTPNEPQAGEDLEEVTVTATRSPRRLFDVPTATTVITNSQAKERSQTSLAELFKGETGVYVRATNPSADSPVIRGVTGRDVLLLVDGFRLSHAFMRPNVQYEGMVDPYFLEQAEIVRGPGSMLYGSDALGGVTNIVTPSYRADAPTFQLYTQYNSNPAAISNHLRLNAGGEKAGATVGLTYRSFGDATLGNDPNPQVFFPNPGKQVARSGFEYYSANAKVGGELASDQFFTITAQYSQIPNVARQDGIIQGFGPSVAQSERGFAPQSRTFLLAEYRHTFTNTIIDDLRLKVGYQQVQDNRYQRNFNAPRPAFPGYGTGIASANASLENISSDLYGAIAELRSTWGNQKLTYGVEAYFDRVSNARNISNNRTGITADPNGPRYVDGSTLNQYGFFLQDEIIWSEQFTSTLGLRYSFVDINIPFSSVRPGSSGFGRNFEALTASAGLLYRLNRDLNLVFNIGQGFRAPNINDLGNAGERRATDINLPNNNLNAETVFSIDGGFKWSGSNFTGELFAFLSEYPNRISSVSLGTVTNSDGSVSEVFQSQNKERESIWGIEFGSRYRFDPQWSIFATANFVYGSVITGDTLIPPFNGAVGVRYQSSVGTYVEPFIRYASLQNRLTDINLTDPRLNPLGTPGFVILNLRAGIPVTPASTLRVNVDNVLNTTYREHGSSLDGAGTSVSIGLDQTF